MFNLKKKNSISDIVLHIQSMVTLFDHPVYSEKENCELSYLIVYTLWSV